MNSISVIFLYIYVLGGGPSVDVGNDLDSVYSNAKKPDLNTIARDTTKVNRLIDYAHAQQFINSDTSLVYATKALKIAAKSDYTKGKLRANYLRGIAFFRKGNYSEAIKIATQSLKNIPESRFRQEKASFNRLAGIVYGSKGSYELSLEYFMRAKTSYKTVGNHKSVLKNLNNIGVIYLKLKNYKKALNIFSRLDTLQTLSSATISIPVNLGYIYFNLGEYDKAEKNLKRVLNFKGKGFDKRALGLSSYELGEVYRAREEYKQAIAYYEQSIQVYKGLKNELKQVEPLNGIALSYLNTGSTVQALDYANKALAIVNRYDSLPQKKSSAKTLYEIYAARNNPAEALKYHILFKSYSDSLLNDKRSKEIGRLEAKNTFEKQKLALKEQQKQKDLKNRKEVAEQRTYVIIALFLFGIAALVGFFFYRNYKLRNKAVVLLKQKNEEVKAQTNKLKELNKVKNNLFSVISHDLRGPLSSLQGIIELYEADDLSKEDMEMLMPRVSQEFKYISSLLTNLLKWSKSQLQGYKTNPKNFDARQLSEDVLHINGQKAAEKGISVKNNVNDGLSAYADRMMIKQVLLNFFSNAIKFTPKNGTIEIAAKKTEGAVKIWVKDTGVGIPENKIEMLLGDNTFYSTKGTNNEKGTGLGLLLSKEFITKNNGSLHIESEVGAGSTFFFTIPAAKHKAHSHHQAPKNA